MNRLFSTLQYGDDSLLGPRGPLHGRRSEVKLTNVLMPEGYDDSLPRTLTISQERNYFTIGEAFEIRITPDPNFVCSNKAVQKFIRRGVIAYKSRKTLTNWLDKNLREYIFSDEARVREIEVVQKAAEAIEASRAEATLTEELRTHKAETLARAAASKPANESWLTEWWIGKSGGTWEQVSGFDESQELMADWMAKANWYDQFFRCSVEPEPRDALIITMPDGETINLVLDQAAGSATKKAYLQKMGGVTATKTTVLQYLSGQASKDYKNRHAEQYSGGPQRQENRWGGGAYDFKAVHRIKKSTVPMRIRRSVYDQIEATVGSERPETGGILGGNYEDGVITSFHFDATARTTGGSYQPGTEEVNQTLREEWNPAGIRLLGVVHSHPNGMDFPSYSRSNDPHSSDFAYIKSILARINTKREEDPEETRDKPLLRMFLPIVMSGHMGGKFRLVSYAVVKTDQGYELESCDLEIIADDEVVLAGSTEEAESKTEKLSAVA